MKSPFPGMDPYLESHWGDVHQRLVLYAADEIQPQLPGDLRARVQERVFVQSPALAERSMYPDVAVVERSGRPGGFGGEPEGGVALDEPLVIDVPDEEVTESFLEIREPAGGKLVTVVEVLSMANKLAGRDQYLQKQDELRRGGVSLVEIDLLRRGGHVLAVSSAWIPASHDTPYKVCVRRGWRPGRFELYAVPLRGRLPVIGVPLRRSDDDVRLNLQGLIDKAYANAAYDDIDYRVEPDPPLEREDAAWADALLREAEKR